VRTICLPVLLLLALSAYAAEDKFVNEQYDLQKIADGVYSFIAPESDSGVVQSNCTVVIGEQAVMVVDTGQFPSLAERMVADIKKLTAKPVRYIVNTHWHFDHVWGNAVFREAYPGVAIISTEYTRELVEEQGPKFLSTQRKTNADQAAQLRKYVADGKLPDGRVISDDIKQRLGRTADTLDHIEPDLIHTVHAPPTIGFDKELTINLGKREVKVMWLGRANTGGDAVRGYLMQECCSRAMRLWRQPRSRSALT
jgi:cyclase